MMGLSDEDSGSSIQSLQGKQQIIKPPVKAARCPATALSRTTRGLLQAPASTPHGVACNTVHWKFSLTNIFAL